jgi:hypothetical protein
MSESSRALNEFVSFLGSPDMYGSMSLAAQMMKWAVHAVVTVLMIAGLIAILFIVLKFAVDVIFLTGVGHLMSGSGNTRVQGAYGKMTKFASDGAVAGDVAQYIKNDLWKGILTLAFIGLLASGMILPLAGQVAGVIGAGVDKLIGLDAASELASFDVADFKSSMAFTRADDLKAQYDKYLAETRTYSNQIYDLGTKNLGSENSTLTRARTMYTAAIYKAQAVGNSVKGNASLLSELKLPSTYFQQHLAPDVCRSTFVDANVSKQFVGVPGVKCSTN